MQSDTLLNLMFINQCFVGVLLTAEKKIFDLTQTTLLQVEGTTVTFRFPLQ